MQVLEDSRKAFHEAAAGLSESQASTSPGEGRWSVLQCVEHVTVVEERFFGFLESAGKLDPLVIDAAKEADLMERVTNRSSPAQAPEPVRPSGRFASLAEAVAEFNRARTRTISYAIEHAAELPAHAWQHPRFGDLNGRELLVIMAGHARRHAEQIREARSAL